MILSSVESSMFSLNEKKCMVGFRLMFELLFLLYYYTVIRTAQSTKLKFILKILSGWLSVHDDHLL